MSIVSAILSLLIAVAGWHYLFHSTAAERLGVVEEGKANLRRVRLRRACGFLLLLLSACLYIGFRTLARPQLTQHDGVVAIAWFGVAMFLMLLVVVLAFLDIRLTARLRRQLKARDARS